MSDPKWPEHVMARSFVDERDHAAVADVFNASIRADHSEAMSTPEEVANDFNNAPHLDLERGLLIVEAAGMPVGYVVAQSWRETDGPQIYRHMAKLRPEYRRRGIGTAMLRWAQRYLTGLAAAHDVADKQFQTDADDDERGAVILLTSDGYRPVAHHADMVRPSLDDIPDRSLPDGIEIRPVAEEHLRQIWEADVEAFRDHFGYTEQTEHDWERFLGDPLQDRALWKVAWRGDQVVGQVRSFIHEGQNAAFRRKRGYTEYISTAREWRGQGIAAALICASLRELAARGMEEAALGVHVDNPTGAYRLYESLGFEVTSSGNTYQRPLVAGDYTGPENKDS